MHTPNLSRLLPSLSGLISLLLLTIGCQTTGAAPQKFCQNVILPTPDPDRETVTVRIQSARWHCWRTYMPALGADAQNLPINVVTQAADIESGLFYDDVEADMAGGNGPDITAKPYQIVDWAAAGYLEPLTACRRHHAAFDQIPQWLWPYASFEGQLYGIPIDFHMTLLFFNKNLLRQMGWTPAEIDALPQQIAAGDFTFFDLIATAEQATAQGIVEKGFGYWPGRGSHNEMKALYLAFNEKMMDVEQHRPIVSVDGLQKTFTLVQAIALSGISHRMLLPEQNEAWSDSLVRRDAIAADRVLFWQENTLEMTNLWYDFPRTRDAMFAQFGLAPRPAAIRGLPGTVRVNPTFYVVPAAHASGRNQQEAACAVLAAAVRPGLYQQQAKTVLSMAALQTEAPDTDNPTAVLTTPFLKQARFLPPEPHMATYWRIVVQNGRAVELGELSPETAASQSLLQMQQFYGDRLIVEP